LSANIGDAIAQAGNQAIYVFGQAKQQADVATLQDAVIRLHQSGSDLLTDPKTGLLTYQGKNALGKDLNTQRVLIKTQKKCKYFA
jgi:hypothetical protein